MSTPGEIDITQAAAPSAANVDGKEDARIQVLRFVDSPAEDNTPDDRRRGLALARRLAVAGEVIRETRTKVEKADGGGRKRCVAGLERLWTVLHGLEQDALSSSGLTDGFAEDAEPVMSDMEDLLSSAAHRRTLKARHVRRLRKEVRHTCRRFESLLGRAGSVSAD